MIVLLSHIIYKKEGKKKIHGGSQSIKPTK
jgi:hypothetical protein